MNESEASTMRELFDEWEEYENKNETEEVQEEIDNQLMSDF